MKKKARINLFAMYCSTKIMSQLSHHSLYMYMSAICRNDAYTRLSTIKTAEKKTNLLNNRTSYSAANLHKSFSCFW